MENTEKTIEDVGEMQKRQEVMPDGKRYMIYYTFGEEAERAEEVTGDV
jgi:hypothetical protein